MFSKGLPEVPICKMVEVVQTNAWRWTRDRTLPELKTWYNDVTIINVLFVCTLFGVHVCLSVSFSIRNTDRLLLTKCFYIYTAGHFIGIFFFGDIYLPLLSAKWIILAVIHFEIYAPNLWKWSEWILVRNNPTHIFHAALNEQMHLSSI